MAEDNVVILDMATRLDIPCDRVLAGAAEFEFETLLVLGVTDDGDLFRASNTSDLGRLMLLMRQAESVFVGESLED